MFTSNTSAASGGTRKSQPVEVKTSAPSNSSLKPWKNARLFLTSRMETSFE